MMSPIRNKRQSTQRSHTSSKRTMSKMELASLIIKELTAQDFSDPMVLVLLELHDNGRQTLLSNIVDQFKTKNWATRTLRRYLNDLETLLLIERTNQVMEFVDDLRKKMVLLTALGVHVVRSFEDDFRRRTFGPLKRGPNKSTHMREALRKMKQYLDYF